MILITRVFTKKSKGQRIAPVPPRNDVFFTDSNSIPKKPHLITHSYDKSAKTQSTCSSSEHSEDPSSYPRQPSHCQKSAQLLLDTSYQVISEVTGHGVSGEVRPCIHRCTKERCAVKTITKSRVRRQDRIRREIDFLSEVDHPSIIQLHDVYEDREDVHIVTELCRGGELFDEIVERAKLGRKHPDTLPPCFDEATAVPIIRSLLEAVSYLHEHDIVHRDIKPENILFVNKNDLSQTKLIDFGLSIRHEAGAPPLKNVVGTSYYMDPALLEGSYDRSCDLWSIGVMVYVMLSGSPPFNGASNDVIFKKILGGKYKMPSRLWDNISDEAKDFIRCLLIRDGSQRWTADMALKHSWLRRRC